MTKINKMFVEVPDEIVDAVLSYESGNLDEDGIIALFQMLIDTGLATQFQGKYERISKQLLISGLCHNNRKCA